jgi:cell division protein FtsB
MRKQINLEHGSVVASLSLQPIEQGVTAFRNSSKSKRSREFVIGRALLERLKAENAELRNSVIELAREIHDLRKGR